MDLNQIVHEYVEIFTDPAHAMVETTFVLIDVLVIDWVRRRLKRHFHRDLSHQHTILDREHGVAFHGDVATKPLTSREIEALRAMVQADRPV